MSGLIRLYQLREAPYPLCYCRNCFDLLSLLLCAKQRPLVSHFIATPWRMVSDFSDKTFDTLCGYKHHIISGCDKQHICECRANVVRTFYIFSFGFRANYPPIPHESCRIFSRHVCIIVVIICITARANDFESHIMLFICERYCALCCTDVLRMIVNTFAASQGLWHLPYSMSVIAISFSAK